MATKNVDRRIIRQLCYTEWKKFYNAMCGESSHQVNALKTFHSGYNPPTIKIIGNTNEYFIISCL